MGTSSAAGLWESAAVDRTRLTLRVEEEFLLLDPGTRSGPLWCDTATRASCSPAWPGCAVTVPARPANA